MAKIFRTESLSVNGDNIRLTSAATDTYKLTTASGTTIMDKTNADIDGDVSSLQAVDVANKSELDSDVSSLQAVDVADKSELDSDVSSLQAVDVANKSDLDSDVSSLAAEITTNDVQVSSTALALNDTSKTITFGTVFSTTPSVVGSLKSSNASDPIIACQMSAISTSEVTFQFSDDIPNNNYTLEILASI